MRTNPESSNPSAVVALVFGVTSVLGLPFLGFVGLIFSFIGVSNFKRSGVGKTELILAFILNTLGVIATILIVAYLLTVFPLDGSVTA